MDFPISYCVVGVCKGALQGPYGFMTDFSNNNKIKQINIRLSEDEYFLLDLLSKRWFGSSNVSKAARFILNHYTKEVIKNVNK